MGGCTDWIAQNCIALKILQNTSGHYPHCVLRGRSIGLDEHGDPARAGYVCNLIGKSCRVSQLSPARVIKVLRGAVWVAGGGKRLCLATRLFQNNLHE